MSKEKSRTKEKVITFAGIFVAAILYGAYTHYGARDVMSVHCDGVNGDPTRPVSRECVSPISFEDNVFTFKNRGGRTEVYDVIALPTDKENTQTYQYIFLEYLENSDEYDKKAH